ncbi:MAG TPA: outer membrane lipoprotein carrier protein LolA [Dongiaceae bacterium]|jgi:outer membrane lipoprotein-sorting protein|nr:outer membrane lipoprotein carrier protein LolA [Dongiaceae bacterium]
MSDFKNHSTLIARRSLLRAGAAVFGAASLSAAVPRFAFAETAQAAQLTDSDKADIARVEGYLNSLSTVKASFQQYTENEGLSFGRIYLRRPGRLRVEYDPPSEILLVADGTLLSYYDAELNHIEQVPLNLSPMWFLLREDVELGGDVTVTSFKRAANTVLIGLVQSDEPDAGSVLLELGDKPMELRQWTIRDSAGGQVRVGLYDAEFGVALEPGLFATPRKKDRGHK